MAYSSDKLPNRLRIDDPLAFLSKYGYSTDPENGMADLDSANSEFAPAPVAEVAPVASVPAPRKPAQSMLRDLRAPAAEIMMEEAPAAPAPAPELIPGTGLADLAEAQKKAGQERNASLFAMAGDNLLGAVSRGKGEKYEPSSVTNKLLELSGQGVKDVMQLREGVDKDIKTRDERLDLDLKEGFNDPASLASQVYRDVTAKRFPGINIPEGATAAQLEKIQAIKAAVDTEYRDKMLALRERQLDQRDVEEARKDATFKNRLVQQDELDGKQAEKLAEMNIAQSTMDSIGEMKAAFDTGPVSGRVANIRAMLGNDDAKMSAFKAKAGRMLTQYIQSMSGAAFSDKEALRYQSDIPNVNDQDATFIAKMADLKKELDTKKRIWLDTLRTTQGKNIPEATERSPQGGSKEVKRKTKDGKVAVFDEASKKFLRFE